MKKAAWLWALALCVLAAGPLAASGQSDTAATPRTIAPAKIQLWWFGGAVREPTMKKIVDKFKEKNPKIDVAMQMFTGWDDLHQKSLLAIAGGDPPDITLVKPINLGDLADRGSLLALDSYIQRDKIDTKRWFDVVATYDSMWKNKYYAAPWNMAAYVLLYNKDRFAQAGLDPNSPPKTWNELLEYGRKMTTGDKWGLLAPGGVNGFLMFLKQNGGEYLSDDLTKSFINEKPGVEAMQFLVDLVQKHKVSPAPGATDAVDLYNGKIAMWYDHNGSLPNFAKFAPKLNFGSAVNPKKLNGVTIEMSTVMSIFKESRYPDQSWELLKWMCYDDDMQMLWCVEIGHLPAVKSLIDRPPFTTEAKWLGFQQQVKAEMWARPVSLRQLEMYNAIDSETQAALLGKKTVEKALGDAQARVLEYMKK
jgi:ABC-type glycerol-3-phosphate transport system substrate-binding protein